MSPKNEASREKQAEIHNRLKKLNEDLPPSTVKIVAKAYQNHGFIKKSTFQDWLKKIDDDNKKNNKWPGEFFIRPYNRKK